MKLKVYLDKNGAETEMLFQGDYIISLCYSIVLYFEQMLKVLVFSGRPCVFACWPQCGV